MRKDIIQRRDESRKKTAAFRRRNPSPWEKTYEIIETDGFGGKGAKLRKKR